MKHSDFIDELGGTGAVAAELGLEQNTVSNWRQRGIPWRYRPAMSAMARDKGIATPADFLLPAQPPVSAA